MKALDWLKEVHIRKDDFIQDLQGLLQIKSVLDEENATEDAPFGQGVKEALTFMLELGKRDGFEEKNVKNVAGHVKFGAGDESIGILCHVDVVPEGDGWSSDPYSAEIRDGKIFARGALDDKGPTMAAYYAMKIIKELDLPLTKEVKMIIGTDEESDWRCVTTYFQEEPMPTMGFAPDADFPIIYAEKGISDFDMVQSLDEMAQYESGKVGIVSFSSGRRYNMVPDFAEARLHVLSDQTEIIQRFQEYLSRDNLTGQYTVDAGELVLELEGVSAHGMEPNNGVNAGLKLASFLADLPLDEKAANYFQFVNGYFKDDSRGQKLGVAYNDDITGDLTLNVGILQYNQQVGGKIGLTCRYPVTNEMEKTKAVLDKLLAGHGFVIENFTDSKPHHVNKDSELIQTLSKVYLEQTGEEPKLISIGGGTYARSLENGVAFGPLFPGRDDIAHQKDEYMFIEDLLKATAIYAQAIYELAK
ncbi:MULTISPECIES: dipeptidase PepV [Bacillaceae]|uniref:dipeptidase PepV n=1 Tax=Bacillaceae TaxID=186817 RepID=UPI001E3705FD|nr:MULTISPECIES: dipeptidase PepV [Bacillaceae]MCE4051287.1 dipeptidase PepV [Bacillus sp. Au-Bac7]MCM3032192.1 dipeptidase PepV [Niallia sp. MER 6]MDL0436733.1 dipeptidase PepV [Niallia sp. SS-2023]UPO86902.1 dipeptidase PepV [Niallia sp. Man26]